jgi:DNA polymerase I-like protein with 3'-5' exonuclease and polymerase domains
MLAEWLIDPASHNLGLKDMAERYLNISMTHIEELIGKGKNQISMDQVRWLQPRLCRRGCRSHSQAGAHP